MNRVKDAITLSVSQFMQKCTRYGTPRKYFELFLSICVYWLTHTSSKYLQSEIFSKCFTFRITSRPFLISQYHHLVHIYNYDAKISAHKRPDNLYYFLPFSEILTSILPHTFSFLSLINPFIR